MLQHVYAHVPEMIFGTYYPYVDITQRYQLASLVDLIHRSAMELPETLM